MHRRIWNRYCLGVGLCFDGDRRSNIQHRVGEFAFAAEECGGILLFIGVETPYPGTGDSPFCTEVPKDKISTCIVPVLVSCFARSLGDRTEIEVYEIKGRGPTSMKRPPPLICG